MRYRPSLRLWSISYFAKDNSLRVILLLFTLLSPLAHAEPLYFLAQKGNTRLLILGSIHVGKPSLYPLPDEIRQFLARSDGLIVEADIREGKSPRLAKPKWSSQEVLNRQQIKKLQNIAKQLRLNPSALLKLPPWASALQIQLALFDKIGLSPAYGVDTTMIALADNQHVPVLGLETLQFQLNLLATLPKGGKALLTNTLSESDNGTKMGRCLITAWQQGDAAALTKFSDLSSFSDDFDNKLLYSRNKSWVKKITSDNFLPSKNGRYTMVVGAMHLIGPGNVLNLLKQQGYSIIQRSTSAPALCQFE